MNKFLPVIFFLLSCFPGFGQNVKNIDSIQQLLKHAKEDTNKVKLQFALALAYQDHDMKQAMEYVRQSGRLSEKLGYNAGSIKYHKKMTYLYATLNQQDSAIWHCNQFLKIATETKDSLNMGIAYFVLGERYNYKSDYETGIAYSLKGIRIIEAFDKSGTTSATLNGSMAATYLMIKDYKKSIEFGEKAEALDRRLGDTKSLTSTLINLGNAYDEVGNDDKAMKAYKEALTLAEQENYTSFIAIICEGIAGIMDKQNNLEQIKYYSEKGLAMATQISDSFNIMANYQNLAIYYLRSNQPAKAKEALFKALKISNTYDYKEAKATIFQSLSNVFYAELNYTEAGQYQRRATKLNEEIFTASMAQKQANENVKYETEKKEAQIHLQQLKLKQQATLNYFLIAGAAALLLITALSYRNYKHRQKLQQVKIEELETEKLLTATAAVLKGEEQERSRLAKDLHDGLGGMLSGIKHSLSSMKENLIMTPDNAQAFERSIDMLDSSISEMRRVAHNMMPEMLMKYGLNTALQEFCNDIAGSGVAKVNYQSVAMDQADITQTTSVAIYRIAQELVNNAVKHGKASEVLVQLHLNQQEKLLALTVEDNGAGFDVNQLNTAKGIGWKNIQSRVDFLKGSLDVQSMPGKGTSVMIEINT